MKQKFYIRENQLLSEVDNEYFLPINSMSLDDLLNAFPFVEDYIDSSNQAFSIEFPFLRGRDYSLPSYFNLNIEKESIHSDVFFTIIKKDVDNYHEQIARQQDYNEIRIVEELTGEGGTPNQIIESFLAQEDLNFFWKIEFFLEIDLSILSPYYKNRGIESIFDRLDTVSKPCFNELGLIIENIFQLMGCELNVVLAVETNSISIDVTLPNNVTNFYSFDTQGCFDSIYCLKKWMEEKGLHFQFNSVPSYFKTGISFSIA